MENYPSVIRLTDMAVEDLKHALGELNSRYNREEMEVVRNAIKEEAEAVAEELKRRAEAP